VHSLKQKILLLTIFPIFFILLIIGGLTVYNKNNAENQALFSRFDSYRSLLESGNLNFDIIQDKNKLSALLNEKVVLAEIIQSDYAVAYSSENAAASLITSSEKTEIIDAFQGTETIKKTTRDGESVISIITPLVVNDKIVAVLHQVLSNDELSARVNQYAFYIALLMLVGLIICYATIFALVNRVVLKNIYKLRQAAIDIQGGNLMTEIKIDSKDEIGELAATFGQMATEIKKNKQKMEEYSKTLEKQVAKRTDDLNHKMDELERANKFMVNREIEMIKLKKIVSELEQEKK
jgi:nitrate/nitrite-specific signal transduction histidine kinase